jgi:sarcosine oxidase subunit beta
MSDRMQADVIIIGSGAVGNAAAYYLTKAGKKVIVLEKEKSIGSGQSCRNGGMNKIDGRGLGELPIAIYGLKCWKDLSQDVDTEYVEKGGIRIALNEDQNEYMSRFLPFGKEYGLHLEEISGESLRRKIPEFSTKITSAIYCGEESKMNPLKTTLGLYSGAREAGAVFISDEEVCALHTRQGRIFAAESVKGNVYEADQILVAAAYGSRKVLNSVGIDVPLYSYYEEIFVTEKIPRILDQMFVSAKVTYYGEQQENGTVVFGGASGFGNFPNRGWYPDSYQDRKRLPASARALADIFPALRSVRIVRGWGGWMDISPDDSMMIGETVEIPGLFVACGFSAMDSAFRFRQERS